MEVMQINKLYVSFYWVLIVTAHMFSSAFRDQKANEIMLYI